MESNLASGKKLQIGELAAVLGLSPTTICYSEDIGAMAARDRDDEDDHPLLRGYRATACPAADGVRRLAVWYEHVERLRLHQQGQGD